MTKRKLTKHGSMGTRPLLRNPVKDRDGEVSSVLGVARDITVTENISALQQLVERKTRELAESEEKFRALVENIPVVLWITRERQTVFISPNMVKILGFAPEEINTNDLFWSMEIHPDDLNHVKQVTEDAYSRNVRYDIEYRLQRKDGDWIWVREEAVSIYERDGAHYMYGLLSDITDRKRWEEQLRSAREQLEYAVFSNPAAIYIAKPLPDYSNYNATYISKSVNSIIGFEAEELIGESGAKFWESRVPPDDFRKFLADIPALWRDGQHAFEYRFLHKDGKYRWIREEERVIRDGEGRVRDVVGYWIDITDRKRLEEELRSTGDRLRFMLSSTPAVIYTSKASGDYAVTFVSDNVMAQLGYEPREFIEDSGFWANHIHPEDAPRIFAQLPKLFETGYHIDDYRFRHKDGSWRWMHDETVLIRDADGNPKETIGYCTDVTERKRLEERLHQVERSAAIGETAAMVGHDLRNPLQGLAGSLYLLEQHYEGIPVEYKKTTEFDATEMLHMMEASVGYMNKIVSDLQNYAAPVQPELVKVSTQQLLEQILCTITIPPYVKVSVTVDKGAETLNVDPDLIRRVFVNLITNAVQAMPQGGELKITAQKNGEEELVSFQDTGVGVSKENLPKLFTPLFTTKAQGQGLGLPVCKRVIEAHGGTITVDSTVGKGSTFTAKLPIPRNTDGEQLLVQ